MNKQELERASAEIYALMRDTHINAASHILAAAGLAADPTISRATIATTLRRIAEAYQDQAALYDEKASVASQESQHAAKANQQGVESGD